MSHRNRTRCIALVMAIPCLLAAPFFWKMATGVKFLSYVKYLAFMLLGFVMLADSNGEAPKMRWAYGASAIYFGYFAFDLARDTFTGFNGFGLSSLTNTAGGVLAAWSCALCCMILLGVMGTKTFKETSSLPIMMTSWGLGVVATLAGINAIFGMRLDGFFGTIFAATFALLVTGLGVMLVKGKQPHLACYGLGTVVGGYAVWGMLFDGSVKFVAAFTGKIAFYGLFGAIVFVAVVATWALGAEVSSIQRKLAASKK